MGAAVCMLLAVTACARSRDGIVSADGSTSLERVIGILGEMFEEKYSGMTFTYNPTGSSSGIQAVLEGRCDIGLASRSLTEAEKARGLRETVFAYDAIVPIVHPENPVRDLSLEQIAGIYAGEVVNWQEVGGNDERIVVIGREAGSGTRDGFESATGTVGRCRYRQELTSSGDIVTAVAQNPAAIGYVSMAAVGERVCALHVDGVEATEDSVRSGAYAIQRPFVLLTVPASTQSDATKKFLAFACSEEARALISAAGVVAAN